MLDKDIEKTLLHIRPGAEWALSNGVITWLDNKQVQPTKEEIEQGFEKYTKDVTEKRNALLEKLGITEEEAKLLLS